MNIRDLYIKKFRNNIFAKKSNVFMYILISYIVVFLVPVLINIVTYTHVINVTKKETAEKNLIISEQLKYSAEQMLVRVENVKSKINANDSLQKVNFDDENLDAFERAELLDVISKLNSYKIAENDFIEDIYLYCDERDLAMGTNGLYTLERLYNTLFDTTDFDFSKFRDMLTRNERMYKPYSELSVDGFINNSIMCILPLETEIYDTGWNSIIITISQNRFVRKIKTAKEYPGTGIFIINKNDEFVVLSDDKEKIDISYDDLNVEKNIFNKKLNGENYMVTFLKSDISDWKYVMIVPAAAYLNSANSLRNILIIGCILALLAGLFIIYKFTMHNYGEIKKIVNLFGEQKDVKNEFEFINRNIVESISENEKLNEIILQSKDDKKDVWLRSLLRGEKYNRQSFQKYEEFQTHFKFDNFVVAAISVDDIEDEKYYEAYAVIDRTLNELLNAETIMIDGIIASIINYDDNINSDDIHKSLKQVVDLCKTGFDMTVTVSSGTAKNDINKIHNSYEEAQNALQYKFVQGTGIVIDYKLVEGLNGSIVYSLEKEQLIVNYAKIGDFEEISDVIDEIFDTNFKDKVVPVQIAKCFVFDILSTLLRIIPKTDAEENEIVLINEAEIVDEIINSNTITEMKESILNVFKKICEHNSSSSVNGTENLSKQIEYYVKQNFKNQDINVSMIADYFGLSGAYISKLFKKANGISILDYIHKERITAAKEMLKQGEIVANVATNVGYNNSNAFIRVFKRYEKITPGQYCNHFGKGE